MNMKITSLMAALVLVMGVGTAQAVEQLSTAQMDSVTAAGYNYDKGKYGKGHHRFHKVLNIAIADAFAECFGGKCFTDAYTETFADKHGSFSYSSSTSIYGHISHNNTSNGYNNH